MPITPITPSGPNAPNDLPSDAAGAVAAPNTLNADAAGSVAVPNTLPADAAGTVAVPNTLPADAAGTVAAPNTLPADAAGTVATPNTLSADAAGSIAAPTSLPSQGAAGFPRSLTPMVDFDFAAKSYTKNGVAVAFDDIFTYTRATSATFINRKAKQHGGYEYFLDTDYVGDVENLLTYSEQLDNVAWGKSNVVLTPNATLSPNNNSSFLVYPTSTGAGRNIRQSPAQAGNNFTFYVKANGINWIRVFSPSFSSGYVNVQSGYKGTSGSSSILDVKSCANGWFRVSAKDAATSNPSQCYIYLSDGDGDTSVTANGTGGILLADMQLTDSTVSFLPYVKTISAPVTKTFAETLRVEYDATTGKNLGALIEAPSTNLCLRSEEIGGTPWGNISLSYVSSASIAPDNTLSATKITFEDDTSARSQQYVATTIGSAYTWSVWMKAGTKNLARLELSASDSGSVTFNLTSDWQRFSVTGVATGTDAYPRIKNLSGAGDIYAWGAQVEALPHATSYIRTEGAAVSRSKDTLGLSPYDVINPSETSFNVVFDSSQPVTNFPMAFRYDALNNDHYRLHSSSSSSLVIMEISDEVFTGPLWVRGEVQNFSGTYDGTISKIYVDKVFVSQDASSEPLEINPANVFYIGGSPANTQTINGHMSKFTTYAQALTQQEIALL